MKISIECRSGVVTAVALANPFYIPKEDALPGFRYDAMKKKSYYTAELDAASTGDRLERDGAADSFVLELDTSAWPAGVHHLRLKAAGRSGKMADYRTFAIKVRGPDDRLEVRVDDSWFFAEGTHFGRFVKLSDGTLLCDEQRSTDGGRTWQGPNGGFGVGATQLRDGQVLGLDYRCLPQEGPAGRYAVERFFSEDGGRTWTDLTAVDTTPYSGYTDVVEIGSGRLLVGSCAKDYLDPKTGARQNQLRLRAVRYRRKR